MAISNRLPELDSRVIILEALREQLIALPRDVGDIGPIKSSLIGPFFEINKYGGIIHVSINETRLVVCRYGRSSGGTRRFLRKIEVDLNDPRCWDEMIYTITDRLAYYSYRTALVDV